MKKTFRFWASRDIYEFLASYYQQELMSILGVSRGEAMLIMAEAERASIGSRKFDPVFGAALEREIMEG